MLDGTVAHSFSLLLWCMGDVGVSQVCFRVGIGIEGKVGRARYGRKREDGCGGGSRILTRCDAAFVLIPIATSLLSN